MSSPLPPPQPGELPTAPATPSGLPQPPVHDTEHCPRHPDREAGRHCTRCGRPACDECLIPADIGSICVDCARRSRPTTRQRANLWNARQPILVTYTLIAINAIVFVWMSAGDENNLVGRDVTRQHLELGLARALLNRDGWSPLGWEQVQLLDDFPWYRLLSAGFIHFGIIHLVFNMFLLFQLGNMLEPALGRVRFVLVYFAGLFGGSLGVVLLDANSVSGGASGAVFGLLGAAAMAMLRRGINPLSTSIGTLLMINLFITFTFPGISIGGHLGGVVAGGLAGAAAFGGQQRFGSAVSDRTLSYVGPALVIIAAIAASVIVAGTV